MLVWTLVKSRQFRVRIKSENLAGLTVKHHPFRICFDHHLTALCQKSERSVRRKFIECYCFSLKNQFLIINWIADEPDIIFDEEPGESLLFQK